MEKSFLLRLIEYINERFPIFPAILFSLLFSSSGVLYTAKSFQLFTVIAFSTVIFLFLFRIRLFDEIKDYKFDSIHYSHRPVQRGLISLKEIKLLISIIIILEIILQIFLGKLALTIYLFLFFYHFLMYKNFFINKFEKKSFFLYILSHQLIFLFYAYYIISLTKKILYIPSFNDTGIFLALFLPAYIYEIGRKCKHRISDEGKFSDDTYIYRWGENYSFFFLVFNKLSKS